MPQQHHKLVLSNALIKKMIANQRTWHGICMCRKGTRKCWKYKTWARVRWMVLQSHCICLLILLPYKLFRRIYILKPGPWTLLFFLQHREITIPPLWNCGITIPPLRLIPVLWERKDQSRHHLCIVVVQVIESKNSDASSWVTPQLLKKIIF